MDTRTNSTMTADNYFASDNTRLSQAAIQIAAVADKISQKKYSNSDNIAFRREALYEFTAQRESSYYQEIQAKLGHEKLTPEEYLYYVLTTDDINNLDLTLLKAVQQHSHFSHLFTQNIDVLIAIREWQTSASDAKDTYAEKLCKALLARNSCQYINLHGVNLSGANLQNCCFDFADLTQANFSNAVLDNACIRMSSINLADFRNVSCRSGGAKISNTSAVRANFDGMEAHSTSFYGSTLHRSSFRNASINGYFDRCQLDEVDFTGSTIGFMGHYTGTQCSMFLTNFTHTKIIDVDFLRVDFSRAKLFSDAAFQNPEVLSAEIGMLHHNMSAVLDEVMKTNKSYTAENKDYTLETYHISLVENIAYHVTRQLRIPDSEKIRLVQAAAEHPVLQPESKPKHCFNVIEKGFFSLFGVRHHRAYCDTSAVGKLEALLEKMERDEVAHRV